MERCLREAGETSSDHDQPAEEAQSEGFIPKTLAGNRVKNGNGGRGIFDESIRGGARNFCLGGPSCNTNIFIKTTPYTHINTHVFFIIYTHFFI